MIKKKKRETKGEKRNETKKITQTERSEMCQKNKNLKKPESFVLSFKCRTENKKNKTKLRVLTSGGEGGGGRTWINIPLLSECIFVSTQSRLGFGITYCTACVPLKGTNCAVSHRGPFGTDFRQVQRNMKSESTRQPPLAFAVGTHLLPVNPHHCESSERERPVTSALPRVGYESGLSRSYCQ